MINIEGVENRFEVPSIIAREALYRLKHHLVFPRIANQTYNEYFEGKVGDTITIKRPYKAKVQSGRILKKDHMIDKSLELTLDKRFHFALEVVDEDVTLNIQDYGNRYLNAGAEELAYQYDIDGGKELTEALFFAHGGDGSGLTLNDAQYIRAHATQVAIPENSQNFAVLNPLDIAALSGDIFLAPRGTGSDGGQGLNSPAMINEAIRKRFRGMLAGWNVLESVHIPDMVTAGYKGTPVTAGDANAAQTGSSIKTTGWTASSLVLRKGQLIQIDGVGEIQPRGDRRATGRRQTFVVTADVNSAADKTATIPIYPEINDGTGSVANPGTDLDGTGTVSTLSTAAFQTTTAKAVDNKAIYIIGAGTESGEVPQKAGSDSAASSATYRQGVFFCGDALEYVNVALARPKTANFAGTERDEETGLSISYAADFDINEMSEIERLDIFYGVKTVYPEIGIRWVGQKVS